MTIKVDKKIGNDYMSIPITVRDLFGALVFCNHAGVEVEDTQMESVNPHGEDRVWTDSIAHCDKCGATRFDGERDWVNAPENGVHQI